MGHAFETRHEAEIDATVDQVWEAIATGPGIDSWFMGRNSVDVGSDGAAGVVRTAFGGYEPALPVGVWDPPRRLAYGAPEAPDGRALAYEFLVEGRAGGSTVLRTVTSGFLPGDDWEAEYEAMTKGGDLFFGTLVEYLTHFAGRTATPVTAFGPPVDDWDHAWATVHAALGLSGPPGVGDPVRSAPDGLPPVDGVVYFVNPHALGVRTGDALYRFLRGFTGVLVAGHHLFADGTDPARAERSWRSWLERLDA